MTKNQESIVNNATYGCGGFSCRILLLFYVWYFILMSSGVMTMQGEVIRRGFKLQDLSFMGFLMILFYLPLCHFIKSSFPCLSSGKHRNCEKIVILMFYISIVAACIPYINESIAMEIRFYENEPKQFFRAMDGAQTAYFAEKGAFATSVDALEIRWKMETTNYKYSVRATKKAAFSYAVSNKKELKSYVGGVFLVPAKEAAANAVKDEIWRSILCKADKPGTLLPLHPRLQNGKLVCETGTTQVTK